MKLITWNCNGALREKLAEIDALHADLLIVQECEDPALSSADYRAWAGNYLWIGTNKNRGLGVFAKNGSAVSALNWNGQFSIDGLSQLHTSVSWSTSDLRLFLPFTLNNKITLLAVWTKGSDQQCFGYIGQLWKYLQIHRQELSTPSTIVVGDFNSNAIWDKPDRWWSHTGVVAELNGIGLTSLYHTVMQEEQGKESTPTFYLHRKLNKPYHIDYAFLSDDLTARAHMQIGQVEDWLHISDHMPLLIPIPD